MRKIIIPVLTLVVSALMFSVTALAQQNYSASLNGLQENPANTSSGRGNCSITLNAGETQFTISCTYSGLVAAATAGHVHDAGPVGVNGPVRFNFNVTGAGTSGTIGPLTFAVTPTQVADLRAKKWYANIHSSTFPGGEIRGQVKVASSVFDNDGDGRTDIKVLRPSNGTFYILNSVNSMISAINTNVTATINSAADDYDGDGRGDLVNFVADGTTRVWIIVQSGSNTLRIVRWGSTATTDQVVPADYDGDGKTDIAIYRRGEGIWYIVRSSDNQTQAEVFGAGPNDIAMVGDFDKDGKNDLTTVRGTVDGVLWSTRRSSNNVLQSVIWGGTTAPGTDFVFPAAQIDVDGDGIQDQTVQRDPNTGTTGDPVTYYVRRSSDGQQFSLQWGVDSDTRLFGDYDGDGKTDFVARRTENGLFVWYIYQSSTGTTRAVTFGGTGDALAADAEDETPAFQVF